MDINCFYTNKQFISIDEPSNKNGLKHIERTQFMKYKLIAVDLDGTLYNDQLKITSDTLNTMIKAQEMGIRIALASGRPLPGLFHARDLLKLNEHHGMLVAYNGGKVVDTTTNEVLYDKYIPDDLAMELLEHLKDYPVNPIIDDGKVLYVTDKNGYRVKEEALNDSMEYVEVPSLTEHLDFHLNKILTAVDPQKTYDVLETIGMPFRDQVTFVRTAPYYIEAIPVGTSKASGLSNVCKGLGIDPSEVIAFGDAENDLEMIQFAGHGVAMGNACDALKDAADEVTLTNNEDGIAHTLNHLLGCR